MDKPPRRLLPGYEPSDQSPPSSSTTSPSGGSSSNNINNNSAPPATSTSKSSTIGLSSSASTSTASASTRRQVTSLACNECRRVKCKCDGERPTCGLCERKGLVCDYDVGPRGRTALMALRHQYTLLETENNQLRELLRLIAILPTTDASEVLDRLRTNEDPLRVLQMVQAARLLIPEANTTGGSSEGGTLTPVAAAAAARPTATATPTPMPQQLPESSTKLPNEHSLTQRYSDEKPKLPRQRSSGSSTVPSDLRMILNEPDDDE